MTEKSANLSEIDPNFRKVEKISLKDQCSDEDIDAAKDEGYVKTSQNISYRFHSSVSLAFSC